MQTGEHLLEIAALVEHLDGEVVRVRYKAEMGQS